MERQLYEVGRRRPRILATAVLVAGLVAGAIAVAQGLHREPLLALPAVLDAGPAGGLPAELEVRTAHGGKLLAAMAAAGRAGASVVDVRALGRHGSGFVAWTDARHSYILTPAAIVRPLLRGGARDLEVVAGGVSYPGRVLASQPSSELALVRVRGRLARGLLTLRPGTLEPGRVAVTVSLRGRRRVQPVDLRLTPLGNLRARGAKRMTIGSPVLLLNGHLGGMVVRGGRDAVVLPLGHCLTRERCFGPTLP